MSEEDVMIEPDQIATGDDEGLSDAALASGELDGDNGDDGEPVGKSPAQLWAEADGAKEKGVVLAVFMIYIAIVAVIIGLLAWLVTSVI